MDLLNGKFKPRSTASLVYCKSRIPAFKERVNSFLRLRRDDVGCRDNFSRPQTAALGCLERSWSSRSASGGGAKTRASGASVEQGFYGALTVRSRVPRFPVSDPHRGSLLLFPAAGGFDQPRFRFQFTFNRYISDYNVMQAFTTAPSYTHNDRFRPNDLSAAYFGNSGSLLMPGQTMLNNTVSFGWRSGDNSVSEQYWGLSNTIEPEHPLFGYITEFKRPFNPLRFNTSFRSYDSHSTSDAAPI